MVRSYLLAAALLVATPLAAAAQFTAVITPPKKEQAVAAEAHTPERADSVQRAKLTDMKVWVDSAASALGSRTVTPRDSVMPVAETVAKPVTVARTPVATSKSAPLPDTASPLPLIALLGFGMAGTGLFLLRKNRA